MTMPAGGPPNGGQGGDQPPPGGGNQPPPAAPDPKEVLPPGVSVQGDKVKLISRRTFNQIKETFMAEGKKEARDELLRELGVKSMDELRKRINAAGNGNGGSDRRGNRRDDRDRRASRDDRTARELEEQRRRADEAEKRAQAAERARIRAEKDARREQKATEGRYLLMMAAKEAGCVDPDWMVDRLHRHTQEMVRGKSPEEQKRLLDEFDESKWFAEEKKTSPHLFKQETTTERVVPTTTGTGGAPRATDPPPPAPPAPTVRDAGAAGSPAAPVDATKLNPQQFSELTTRLGLSLNS